MKQSMTHSVFLISIAAGAGGIAIADSVYGAAYGGLGFLAGFLSGFVGLSFLTVISDARSDTQKHATTEPAEQTSPQEIITTQQELQHTTEHTPKRTQTRVEVQTARQ